MNLGRNMAKKKKKGRKQEHVLEDIPLSQSDMSASMCCRLREIE